jgi:metal-dependent amidase/aminoacylase/carboxypeptidase family protein
MSQKSIDPVVMAVSAVMRPHTVLSRELAMTDGAVVGTLWAGMSENVIPDRAPLRLNVRTFKDQVRARVLAAIRRALEAKAASGAPKPPGFSVVSEYLLTRNDGASTRKVVAEPERHFGTDRMHDIEPATAGEDRGLFSATWVCPRRSGCRRHRPGGIQGGRTGGQARRDSDQSLAGLRTGDAPHPAHRIEAILAAASLTAGAPMP